MINGNFYFLKDKYFIDFPDKYLMKNKELISGVEHNRPCFYSFIDSETGIYWMIPFSSQIGKFKDVYSKKVKKYGFCDTIVFGSVLGHKKAFLIQNMCPVLPVYISNEYVDKNSNLPVHIEEHIEDILTRKAKKVLQLQRKGKKLIFPDVLAIEHVLLELMVVEQVAATSDQESKE